MKTLLQKNISHHEASLRFASELYQQYLAPEKTWTVFFEGGLGAGKTFLIREILRCAGVEKEIPSPTYVFLTEYKREKQQFAHFDFYRLADPQEFFVRGFDEVAQDDSFQKLVEWPEKISPQARQTFSGTHFTIKIDYGVGVGMRKIKVLQ